MSKALVPIVAVALVAIALAGPPRAGAGEPDAETLYRVYHHELADEAWPAVAASAGQMAEACRALASAPLPRRLASRETAVRPEITALCAKSHLLEAAAAGPDRKATAQAVEAVHAQYEKVEGLLR